MEYRIRSPDRVGKSLKIFEGGIWLNEITLGSLFDGIGGFPYAASFYGIRSLWASEIVPECVSVTKRHFPEMAHMGDITRLHGDSLPPVDIITFGSPCQGLSMAGQRKGLADERSGLFMEAIRIIYEMKEATHGKYPKIALWENVPGALSSAGGCDYKAVLEAFTKAKVPMPHSGRWANAGMVRSRETDLAWCVYNAQYFGTAQRRRRVFLVADFTGKCAGEILFIPKSLQGYFEAGGTPRQGVAAFTERGTAGAGGENSQCLITSMPLTDNGHSSLIPHHFKETVEILNDQGGSSMVVERSGISPTLRSQTHGNLPVVAGAITSVGINGDIAGPLVASYYKGTGARNGKERDVVLCIATGQSNAEVLENKSPTLNHASEQPYVVRQFDMVCMGTSQANASILDNKSPTLTCAHGQVPILSDVIDKHYVRRLTPLECERLQGFPDFWTELGHEGQELSDTKRYQMLGNSVAVPCVAYIMQGIYHVLSRIRE